HSDQRGSLGMHYTSVANIMKVIEPLFLNDLKQQLANAGNNEKKLIKLLDRLYHLRLFDPACGSGNFLIIAYKELCQCEIEAFKKLQEINPTKWLVADGMAISGIRLTQFYGIELDDFAHETAKLSLWLAEHQMNLAFKAVFGSAKPTLPLQDGGHIICGNATRVNWEEVCPKEDGAEIYIMGNPPYLGGKLQSKNQKSDLQFVALEIIKFKNLDYISCWFIKATNYIQNFLSAFSFVSTNSICQGEQVALLWPYLFTKGVEIEFAYQSFKWMNNAKGNAGITCIIVGIRNIKSKPKYLFKGSLLREVKNINAYLAEGGDLIVEKQKNAISNFPKIYFGSMPRDEGYLVLSSREKESIIQSDSRAEKFILKYIGSKEFIRSESRYCLWIKDQDLDEANSIIKIRKRIEAVKNSRLQSKAQSTRKYADQPHRFVQISYQEKKSIIIPSVSSERRGYIPIGFLESNTVISNLAFAIYDPEPHIFAIISSRIHMTWVRAVAGRLKTDYRYSSALCYNTFPFPEISKAQKTTLEDHVFNVLDEREKHPEKTMAELYDPDKMPECLRQAHHEMDLAVEQCYRKQPFKSDEERLEYLFKLFEEMIKLES
ncbi:MAG: DNA methyltransferase, partial [Methylococcaceae bacterium]